MRCPFCSHDETQVVETRESDEGDVVRVRLADVLAAKTKVQAKVQDLVSRMMADRKGA